MLDFVLNFLFPPVCGICGKLDENWICEKCKKRIEKYEKFKLIQGKEEINQLFNFRNIDLVLNSLENKISNNDEIHKLIYFDEFLYCFEYKGLIRNLILKYKFSDCGYLSNLFANVILNNKKINEIFESYDIMIPVPMDKMKKQIRGYNQTELITKVIEKSINLKEKNSKKIFCETEKSNYKNTNSKIIINNKCLIKIKNTKTQSTLSADERTENIKNAFLVDNKLEIKNKKIILFDDIATTGSTINEISKILKEAGVKKILVLVIAKD